MHNHKVNGKRTPHSFCPRQRRLTRRSFLQTSALAVAGTLLAGCGPKPEPEATTAPDVVIPAVSSDAAKAKVAIAKATTYDPDTIYARVRDMLDGLGGLGDIVRPGDHVAIKTNLTGGTNWEGKTWGLPAVETFVTHPEVVKALGKLVLDAGAGKLYIVEAVYQWDSYPLWGYEDAAKELGATLIDLNATEPYNDFAETPVPGGGKLYNAFTFNHILEELDTFMSVSKMKCHWIAGVTHTMKNLFGLVPFRFYERNAGDGYRSGFHGPSDQTAGQRVPTIINELNRARPLHFGLVDGIKTTEGGEGPWIEGVRTLSPGVLIAGKDVVATDAVATAAMGFDPTAPALSAPFIRGENHLQIASDLGLGTNRLDEIEVVGAAIDDVKVQFKTASG